MDSIPTVLDSDFRYIDKKGNLMKTRTELTIAQMLDFLEQNYEYNYELSINGKIVMVDFKTENEYRVAIFYPYDSDTIIHFKNKKVKVFGSTKDMNFIEVGIDDDIGMKRIILEIKTKNGTLIKP